MPTFKGQENKTFTLLPAGDYTFEVISIEAGLQTGTGKTAGSPYWELKLAILDKDGNQIGIVFERLIDHPSCDFKIDTFLRSTNAAPPLGQAFEFMRDLAETSGVHWIDPIGLRGWTHLIVDEYEPKAGGKQKRNKVGSFLTNKPKVARAPKPETVDEPAGEPETDGPAPF